jgi:hypothetical protein
MRRERGMSRKTTWIVILLALACAAVWSDVIPFSSATNIYAYVESLYVSAGGNHYVVLDGERSITRDGTSVTLTQNTIDTGYLAVVVTEANAKDLLALMMMARAMDWRVRFRLSSGTTSNGYNIVSYSIAPNEE